MGLHWLSSRKGAILRLVLWDEIPNITGKWMALKWMYHIVEIQPTITSLFTDLMCPLSADNEWRTWIGETTCGLGVCHGNRVMWASLGPAIRLSLENDFSQHLNKASSCLCMSEVAGILSSSFGVWMTLCGYFCSAHGSRWQLKVMEGHSGVCVFVVS